MSTQNAPASPTTLKVALLGSGTVGSQVARILTEDAELLTERSGARLELAGVFVRTLGRARDYEVDSSLYTQDAEALVDSADIVIELMGGIEPARTLILRALNAGTSVVTGNKALLAQHGAELYAAADAAGAQLAFEASVAGAIPILRPLRDSLAGDKVTRIMGIANGTTNYILDQMDTEGADFQEALAEAQRLGYAEADPTADIEGHDAAAKAAILAEIAFGSSFTLDQVDTTGITAVTAGDNEAAAAAGYVIKLLAIVEHTTAEDGTEGAVLRVHPALLRREHPLASVRGAFNAIFVEAENAGELMFYGPGAGGPETASAVMGDTVSIAERLVVGGGARRRAAVRTTPALPIDEAVTSYMLRVRISDRPGSLKAVAGACAERGISMETVRQVPDPDSPEAEEQRTTLLQIITHPARERSLAATVEDIKNLDMVAEVASVLRVEGN